MDNKNLIKEFPVTIYGNLTKYSKTISKARCRIFYKYDNRNGTYITDEFAEKLLSTIAYTPIKGIYEDWNKDYTDHGARRDEGRIYGIVPEQHNFAWEKHLDEDGVEREYACVDVLLYSALYKEAEEIINKSQSMELYEPSIQGSWKIINGKKMFEFSDACFLGLQVLGDDVEPCFEGAAFFNLYNSIKDLMKELENYSKQLPNLKTGEKEMFNFKLSDSQKHDLLFNLLNQNFTEEGGWIVENALCEVYDDYALIYNYDENSYYRAYYGKNDEEDTVQIFELKKTYVLDVTEEEKNALEALRALNNNSYELSTEVYEKGLMFDSEKENFELQIENLQVSINELTEINTSNIAALEEANNNLHSLEEQINSLTEEKAALEEYKLNVENKEKEAIITSYSEILTEEVLEQYHTRIGEFTIVDLDKELAYEAKKSGANFGKQEQNYALIPKEKELTGIEAILSRYKK